MTTSKNDEMAAMYKSFSNNLGLETGCNLS